MPTFTATLTRILLMAGATTCGLGAASQAQPAVSREIPQSIRLQHEQDIRALTSLTRDTGGVGAAARKGLVLIQKHHARENEYILPPLVLLPAIANGKVTKDMVWAVAMADKLKENREEVFLEHAAITDAMNDLLYEANEAHNDVAAEIAMGAVADSLNDMEIQEPSSIMVGDAVRAKLAGP